MPSALMLTAAISALAYLCLIIYRFSFHSLARFPGPRLAAATHWYEAYFELIHAGGSQYAGRIRKMHDRYGPIVRINPDEISVRDAAFHDKLYAPAHSDKRDRHPYFSATLGTTKGSFSTVDHSLHRSRRMAYSPFWGSANVMAAEPLIRSMVNGLCERIWTMKNQNTKLRTLFAATSFDNFYTWAFGSSLGLLDDPKFAQEINQAVEVIVTSPPFYRIFPTVMAFARRIPPATFRYLSSHIGNVLKLHAMIVKTAEDWESTYGDKLQEEKSTSSGKPLARTLFAVIKTSSAPDEEKTAFRMAQEGVEMFMAAYTPGRTMMLGMYYLHAHPQILEKLRNEVDQVNPDPAVDLTFSTLNSLPYLRAVVKEILRMTFPVGTRLPLMCGEDIEFQKWIIPAQTAVSVNHRDLLFDPEVFVDPYKFSPERWLDDAHHIDEKRYNVPFGKGARGCPSKEFATHFIQLTLATLIRRFEFEMRDTIWERDVAVSTESILTAPSSASNGITINLVGSRRHG
ncbi:cytochrome P450 [Xylariaceae sp. FL0662B]|nr:cytochrome P450 [Xylariaceae sp. FL0662B]